MGVGYVSGVVRANFVGVFSTFMFDAAVLGLYSGYIVLRADRGAWSGRAANWTLVLTGWPALLSLIPVNDILVQFVALRATVGFVPVILLATRFTTTDQELLARSLAALNLVALIGGLYVYIYGIEALFPRSPITEIIYRSRDVGGGEYYRVPSFFLNAHAYGLTMLLSLPLILGYLFGPPIRMSARLLAALGVVAAVAGILLCAARQPVAMLGVALPITWACTRFNAVAGMVGVGLVLAVVGLASADGRLQRAATLDDTEYVSNRIQQSANESFFELLQNYPAGAGMGSSAGTSVPFFLADRAPVPIGLENEYCRILIDQGWVGLGVWVGFIGWVFARPPMYRPAVPMGVGVVLMYAFCLTNWATAFIGLGTLAGVPAAVLLLTQMGFLIKARSS